MSENATNVVVGVLKDLSQFIVGSVIEETDSTIKLKEAVILAISGQGSQVSINFIPLDMLSLNPPVGVRNLIADPTEDIQYSFAKQNIIAINRNLGQTVIDNYKQFVNKSPIITPSKPSIVTPAQAAANSKPDENIIRLF